MQAGDDEIIGDIFGIWDKRITKDKQSININ